MIQDIAKASMHIDKPIASMFLDTLDIATNKTLCQAWNMHHALTTQKTVVKPPWTQLPIHHPSEIEPTVPNITQATLHLPSRQEPSVPNILHGYLGVPVKERTYMFGDNQSVITSSTIPQSALNKRHNALSYHRVKEAISAGIMRFIHSMGSTNPSDVLSKHCGYPQLMPLVRPILFWQGDPTSCNDGTSDELEPEGSCTENNRTSVDPSTKPTCTK
jgi:hypothetical protein